jgi:hypothetical protein
MVGIVARETDSQTHRGVCRGKEAAEHGYKVIMVVVEGSVAEEMNCVQDAKSRSCSTMHNPCGKK